MEPFSAPQNYVTNNPREFTQQPNLVLHFCGAWVYRQSKRCIISMHLCVYLLNNQNLYPHLEQNLLSASSSALHSGQISFSASGGGAFRFSPQPEQNTSSSFSFLPHLGHLRTSAGALTGVLFLIGDPHCLQKASSGAFINPHILQGKP